MQTQRDLATGGRAARALARSGLAVVRVPEDLPELARHGFLEAQTIGVAPLVRLGLLRPVARGLFEVRDPTGVARSSFELLVAARFGGAPHLVTGWWALAQAGLTSQDVREVVVLSQTNRRDMSISGRRVRVAKVAPEDLWGGETHESGLVVARPERAFCDCAGRRPARLPATRIAEALDPFLGSSPNALQRLVLAVERFRSPAAARRLGYLVELVAGEEAASPFQPFLGASHRAYALDPSDENSPIVPRWQIRTQLMPGELLEHRRVS